MTVMHSEVYLDANATAPVLAAAVEAAVAALADNFGNPSSSHAAGLRAKNLLDATRACARRVLGAQAGACCLPAAPPKASRR